MAKYGAGGRRSSRGSRLGFGGLFESLSIRFWVFAAFVGFVFLTGGGSRDDVSSLIVLRPACALFIAYALTVARPGDFSRVRVPLLLLAALAVWMVIQLLPLPTGLWSALPGRAAILATDHAVGLGDLWRPISLSPSKTVNSLGSLIVPAAALLLYAIQNDADRRKVIGLVLAAAAATALMGIGQLGMAGKGPLYLYAVTNDGFAVGLFANRNHNSVFVATTLVLIVYLLADRRLRGVQASKEAMVPMFALVVAILVFATLLVTQSRAGLLIGVLAAGGGGALWLATPRGDRRESHHGPVAKWRTWVPAVAAIAVALAACAYLFSRSTSFDRLMSLSVSDEVRVQVFPQIAQMINDQWLLGTGFGSFEYAYRPYEASEWLRDTYLNNAHDDWAQWVIEGGLPAILIALAFVLWFAGVIRRRWADREAQPGTLLLAAAVAMVLALLVGASALDYPLRVPSLMVYAMLMIALAADPPTPLPRVSNRRSSRKEMVTP